MNNFLTRQHQKEVSINCMFCLDKLGSPDSKQHLYINVKKGLYNCFRCGSKGHLTASGIQGFKILAEQISEKDETLDNLRSRISNLHTHHKDELIDLNEISYPLSKEGTPIAQEYITKRGFTEEEIEKFHLRVGKNYKDKEGKDNHRWCGRILFPFIDEGVKYIVGRSYTGKEPKYSNTNTPKNLIVYGLEFVENECILCEGIISAIAAYRYTGVPGISCLGKTPSNLQLTKIRSKCDTIYYSLDGDVTKEERHNVLRQLFNLGFKVFEVKIPLIELPNGEKIKDPDDFKEEYLKFFKEAKRLLINLK